VHCYGNGNNGGRGGSLGGPEPHTNGYGPDDVSGHVSGGRGGGGYGLEDDLSSAAGTESMSQRYRKADSLTFQ
jgi:hypothetical protein